MGKKIIIDMTELGRKGGEARAKKLSPKRRSAIAKKAVRTRWKNAGVSPKKKAAPKKRAAKKGSESG